MRPPFSCCSISLVQADQRIDGHGAPAGRPHDDRIDVDFDQAVEVRRGVARHAENRVDQRIDVARRACRGSRATSFRRSSRASARVDRRASPRREDSVTLSASSSVSTPPAPSTSTWPNCGSTMTPDQNLGDAVADHFLDQQRVGQRR